MKYLTTIMMAIMLAFAGGDLRVLVVTTNPQMHCQNCENKIKNEIRFEPGVRKIETNVPNQRVSIEYNPKKTDAKKISAAFARIGYDVKVISDKPVEPSKKKSGK